MQSYRYSSEPSLLALHSITNSNRPEGDSREHQFDARIYNGIPIDITRMIARVARNFATDNRKKVLGLGLFITQVAYYLEIDLVVADLTEVSASAKPADLTVL